MTKKSLVLISLFLLISSYTLINRLQTSNFTVFNDVSVEEAEIVKNTLTEAKKLSFTALMCNEIRVPFDDAS